jgi:hypothetical protein
MAKRKESFNLSGAIREFQKANPKATANEALAAVTKTAGGKINEGTFRSTFYKLKGERGGKRRVVRRRKPGRGEKEGSGIIAEALAFIRSAGGIEGAKRVLAELEAVREL